jgi:hypothetical protein
VAQRLGKKIQNCDYRIPLDLGTIMFEFANLIFQPLDSLIELLDYIWTPVFHVLPCMALKQR